MSCGPKTGWCGRVKPHHPYTADQCQRCWLMTHSADHRRNWGVDGPALSVPAAPSVRQAAPAKKPCCGGGNKPQRVARPAKAAAPAKSSKPWSAPQSTPKPQASAPTDTIPAGIVIGSYLWPELIDLQLRVIHATVGRVPVLVVSDNPRDTGRLETICRAQGAVLFPSTKRIGHCGGDLAVYYRGVQWAAATGLRVLAKLSQRCVITRPGWLQEVARDLLLSSLPAAGRWAVGPDRGPSWGQQLRTEAMLLDVPRWNRPEVLRRLEPRKRYRDKPGGYTAEEQVLDLLRAELGGVYHPWGLLPDRRDAKADGLVWHHANTREEYDALAARHGVVLPKSFTVDGWGDFHARGEHDFG